MTPDGFNIDPELIDAADFGAAATNVEKTAAIEAQRLNEESADSEITAKTEDNQQRIAQGDPTKDEEAKLKDDPDTPEYEDLKKDDPRRDGVGWNIQDIAAEAGSAIFRWC